MNKPHQTPSIGRSVERAARLEMLALICVRQARDASGSPARSVGQRRQLLAEARAHVDTALQILLGVQEALVDSRHSALLAAHCAALQALGARFEIRSAEEMADGRSERTTEPVRESHRNGNAGRRNGARFRPG